MYCNNCGKGIQDDANLCPYCGRRIGAVAEPRHLVRPPKGSPDRKIAGVCAAFAQYFDLDVMIVRVVWLLVLFCAGTGLLAYIICWIVIPEAPAALPVATQGVQPYQNP
jgi:phage shock protein C